MGDTTERLGERRSDRKTCARLFDDSSENAQMLKLTAEEALWRVHEVYEKDHEFMKKTHLSKNKILSEDQNFENKFMDKSPNFFIC